MSDSTAVLVGLAVVVVLVATLLLFVIPEPAHRAIVATERLDLAVLAFANGSSQPQWDGVDETVRARVENALVNEPGIDVFSRSQLDSLLAEQMMSETGLIDADTAVKIGSITGVNKLVAGIVYGVEWREEPTTVCLAWENGACSQEGPGTRYSIGLSAQISVIDTQTGSIEQSIDSSGSDTLTLPEGTVFGGYDRLLANAADEIARSVTSTLSSEYTRELRYGLYASVEAKREGFVGRGESSHFTSSDAEIYLIVHVTRSRPGELFDVVWSSPSLAFSQRIEDVVSDGDWRVYPLDVSILPPGRYTVQGILGGTAAFDVSFTLAP